MAERFDLDTDGTDNELLKEVAEVFKKHGYVAFVYSAAKGRNANQWIVDTSVCIDDDRVPEHLHENCLDTMMSDLTDVAHNAIHDIQDRTPKTSELKH